MRFLIHNFLINPAFWLVVILGWWMLKYFKQGGKRWILGLSLLAFILGMFKPVANLLLGALENKYPVLHDIPAGVDASNCHILVLGSGQVTDLDLRPEQRLSESALARTLEGIKWQKSMPNSRLVFSGSGKPGYRSSAGGAYLAALALGAQPALLDSLHTPRHTMEEAMAFREVYGQPSCLILVTSASHMPRAMRVFEREGLNPIPAPTYFQIKKGPDGNQNPNWWIPNIRNLILIQMALHEHLGLILVRLSD